MAKTKMTAVEMKKAIENMTKIAHRIIKEDSKLLKELSQH